MTRAKLAIVIDGAEPSGVDTEVGVPRSQLLAFFAVAVVASVVLPRVPFGRYVLYPFALLGTWAHELGHGIMAILLGGSFERLQVDRTLGGVAVYRGVGELGTALVAAAGLLGPALVGAVVILLGARTGAARRILAVLGIVVVLSVVLVVRSVFGVVALGLIGTALVGIGFAAPDRLRVLLAQFIGVQFCLASLGSLDYMFTDSFVRDGQRVDSDTGAIADVLLLPYWFWAVVIAALSFAIMAYAFWRAWIRPTATEARLAELD